MPCPSCPDTIQSGSPRLQLPPRTLQCRHPRHQRSVPLHRSPRIESSFRTSSRGSGSRTAFKPIERHAVAVDNLLRARRWKTSEQSRVHIGRSFCTRSQEQSNPPLPYRSSSFRLDVHSTSREAQPRLPATIGNRIRACHDLATPPSILIVDPISSRVPYRYVFSTRSQGPRTGRACITARDYGEEYVHRWTKRYIRL